MSEKITLLDKTFVKYIDGNEVDEAITRVAKEIMLEYRYDDPILLITLNGAVFTICLEPAVPTAFPLASRPSQTTSHGPVASFVQTGESGASGESASNERLPALPFKTNR